LLCSFTAPAAVLTGGWEDREAASGAISSLLGGGRFLRTPKLPNRPFLRPSFAETAESGTDWTTKPRLPADIAPGTVPVAVRFGPGSAEPCSPDDRTDDAPRCPTHAALEEPF
jgi:hypothetical protein